MRVLTRVMFVSLLTASLAHADFVDVAARAGADVAGDKQNGIAWADLDGDGCLDLVVNTMVDDADGRTRVLVSDCARPPSFEDRTDALAPGLRRNGSGQSELRSLVAGDLDNDGDLELLRNWWTRLEVFDNRGRADGAWLGLGTGVDRDPAQVFDEDAVDDLYDGFNSEGLALLDCDSDGDLDLVQDNHGGGIILYTNDGAGVLTPRDPALTGLPSESDGDGDYLTVGDYNADGHVDLVVRRSDEVDAWRGTGACGFVADASLNFPVDGDEKGGVALCDLNRDGFLDAVYVDHSARRVRVHTFDPVADGFVATDEPQASAMGVTTEDLQGIACGDGDDDGDADLFITAAGDGDDYLFINRTRPGEAPAFERDNRGIDGRGAGSHGAAFADYDADGDLDLVVNHDGGVQLWESDTNDGGANNYLEIRPVHLAAGMARPALGSTIRLTDADGFNLSGRFQAHSGSGKGSGGDGAGRVHIGLSVGRDAVYQIHTTFPGGRVVRRCVVPSALASPVLTVSSNDANDLAACDGPLDPPASACGSSDGDPAVVEGGPSSLNTWYPAPAGVDTALAPGARAIPVGAPIGDTPIAAGDVLLVIQMQGAAIHTGSTIGEADPYGDGPGGLDRAGALNDAGFTAGVHEYAVAAGPVDGGEITLEDGLANAYINSDEVTEANDRGLGFRRY